MLLLSKPKCVPKKDPGYQVECVPLSYNYNLCRRSQEEQLPANRPSSFPKEEVSLFLLSEFNFDVLHFSCFFMVI